jgi:hypothetical protein
MIYDIFVNCSWVATRWQQYSTHLHTNSTQNDTKQTIHRTTQNIGSYSMQSFVLKFCSRCVILWNAWTMMTCDITSHNLPTTFLYEEEKVCTLQVSNMDHLIIQNFSRLKNRQYRESR